MSVVAEKGGQGVTSRNCLKQSDTGGGGEKERRVGRIRAKMWKMVEMQANDNGRMGRGRRGKDI